MESADDIQEVIKDLLGGPIKSMMKSKIDEYLGYESYERILGQKFTIAQKGFIVSFRT